MTPLITRNEIAQYRQVSNTPHDAKLNEMILDAQLLDLQPLLGERLFNKLVAAPADYAELMTGGTYEHDGLTYTNYGLKMVLAYFAYARYVMFGSVIDTPFSIVEKLNQDSRPAESSSKKSIYGLNREAAFQIWENVKNYLVRTKQPDFNHGCGRNTTGSFRFTKIG